MTAINDEQIANDEIDDILRNVVHHSVPGSVRLDMTPRTIRRIFDGVRKVENFGGIDEHVDFVAPIVAILVALTVFRIRFGYGLSLNMMRPRICGNAGKKRTNAQC